MGSRRLLVALLMIAAAPRLAAAQAPPASRREGVGVAVLITAIFNVGKVLSLRVSVPAGEKTGFDFDIGWTFSRAKGPQFVPIEGRIGNPPILRWRARGLAASAHVRWMPKGRSETGWSTAITSGVRFLHSVTYNADIEPVERKWVFAPDLLGVSFDRVLESGYRVGGEIGGLYSFPVPVPKGLDFDFPMLYAGLFGAWMQR